MKYFYDSFIYKTLSGSWLFSWMVLTRSDNREYYQSSFFHNLSQRILDWILALLYKIGDGIKQTFNHSFIFTNLLAIVGIAIFIFLTSDVLLNDYGRMKTAVQILIALSALLLPLLKIIPGLFKGSLLLSIFTWWVKTD